MNAEELARDDDYSLSCDLFDLMCNDDQIRPAFNRLIGQILDPELVLSLSIDSLEYRLDSERLMIKMIKFGADFYKERAYDNE